MMLRLSPEHRSVAALENLVQFFPIIVENSLLGAFRRRGLLSLVALAWPGHAG